jgi:hypothetical protein
MSSTEKISNSEAQLRLMLTRLVLTAGADLLPAAAVLLYLMMLMLLVIVTSHNYQFQLVMSLVMTSMIVAFVADTVPSLPHRQADVLST